MENLVSLFSPFPRDESSVAEQTDRTEQGGPRSARRFSGQESLFGVFVVRLEKEPVGNPVAESEVVQRDGCCSQNWRFREHTLPVHHRELRRADFPYFSFFTFQPTLRLCWGSLSKSMSKSNSSLYLRIQIIDSFVLHLQHILGVNTVLDDLGLLLLFLSRHQVYFHLREEGKCSKSSFHVYLLEGLVGQAGLPQAILQPRARRPSAPAGCRRRAG